MKTRRTILLLNDGDAAVQPAPQEQSFRERKLAELSTEAKPHLEEANFRPDTDPERDPESSDLASDVQDDGYPELHTDDVEGEAQDDSYADEDPDGEPSSEDPDQPQADAGNWEKRFKDAQRTITELSEDRNAVEREFTESIEGTMALRHDLEDKIGEARRYTEAISGNIEQQIQGLENAFRSGQVEPEKMAEARAHYQMIVGQRDQLKQTLEFMEAQHKEANEKVAKRQAEITKARLTRTIPGWSREKYDEMREFAVGRGYSADEFNNQTDYRFFELLNDSMLLKGASKTVKDVRRKKRAGAPTGRRNVDRQPRDSQGRYRERKARQDFENNPGKRGGFAAMKFEQLRRER